MKINEIRNAQQLRDFMTTPSEKLVEFMKSLEGDIIVLGAGGKMGPELLEMMVRADKKARRERRLIGVSILYNPQIWERLNSLGVSIFKGDLSNEQFLESLPDVSNCIYMAGFKFGSSQDYGKAFQMNVITPYLVGKRYANSRIVVFSSGNPYPHTPPEYGGCKEEDRLDPQGIYGWTIVGREEAFKIAVDKGTLCFMRLMYAQHLTYGVLVDLAIKVRDGEEISLRMPYVNLVSQRDANEVAIHTLSICSSPPVVLNVAGPILSVKYIAGKFAELMKKKAKVVDEGIKEAILANDKLCRKKFGPYRDGVEEMIEAIAYWVSHKGETWNIPTGFGNVDHRY